MAKKFHIGVVIDADAKRAKRELGDVDDRLNKIGRSSSRAFSSFTGNLAADAVQNLASLALSGAAAVFDFSSKLEQTKTSFETFTGSASAANAELEKMLGFAKDKPFQFDNFANLSIRLRGVKQTAEEIPGIMTDIGNAVAATGEITDDRFKGVGTAITQILGKGRVSAEEMEQLAERNINAWSILEDQLKRPQAEIRKLAEQGQISSKVFLDAFRNFSQANFGDAMEKQSRTFSGSMTRIQNIALIASRETFQPFYEEISKFSTRIADNIESQETSLKGVFRGLGHTLGQQYGIAFAQAAAAASDPEKLIELMRYFPAVATFNAAFEFGVGAIQGFQDPVKEIDGMAEAYAGVGRQLKALPSVAETLQAKEAEKQAKALNTIYEDLSSQMFLFGRETEFAATQQKLISAGITDLSSAEAKRALNMAKTLDRLKSINKEQKDYADNLKRATDYLTTTRDNARFAAAFPEATELQNFDRWARENAKHFKELTFEIQATRRALEHKQWMEAWENFETASKMAFAGLEDTMNRIERKFSDTDSAIEDFFSKFTLAGKQNDIARQISSTVEAIAELDRIGGDSSFLTNNLEKFLETLNVKLADGRFMRLFGDKKETAYEFVKWLKEIQGVVSKNALDQGLEKLDERMASLNLRIGEFGKQTELEKLNEFLADPGITKAIEERAKALGLTADALKDIMRQAQATDPTATRPRIVGEDDGLSPLQQGLGSIDRATGSIRTMDDVMRSLGDTAADVFMQMGEGLGTMVEQWVLLGDQADVSFSKMVASVLSGVAAQSATLAVFHTAMGIAALTPWGAAIYGPAPLHFKAAAVWGAIAVGTALAGRAVAGNSFSGSGSEENRPDYVTTNSGAENGFILPPSGSNNAADQEIRRLAEAVGGLQKILKTASPGDVLVRGSNQKRGFLAERTTTELTKNPTQMKKMGRALKLD